MGTFLSCNRLKRKLNAEQRCLHTQKPPKSFSGSPVRVVASASSQSSHPANGQKRQLLSGVMLAWQEVTTAGSHCCCHIFGLCGMQEQYELVYDAVIELFKRQIQELDDAQKDSAASQVKGPGQTPCLVQPRSALTSIPAADLG